VVVFKSRIGIYRPAAVDATMQPTLAHDDGFYERFALTPAIVDATAGIVQRVLAAGRQPLRLVRGDDLHDSADPVRRRIAAAGSGSRPLFRIKAISCGEEHLPVAGDMRFEI